jgi:hypothetical protein
MNEHEVKTDHKSELPEGAIPLPGLIPLLEHHGIDMEGRMAYAMPAEPTKQREGDQVLPSGDESLVDDQQLLIDDIEERREVGISRYGQGHRPFNGRDTLQDLYEEQLDLLVYFRSLKRMAEAAAPEVIDVISAELQKNGLQQIVCDAMAEQVYLRIQGWVAANIMKENRG